MLLALTLPPRQQFFTSTLTLDQCELMCMFSLQQMFHYAYIEGCPCELAVRLDVSRVDQSVLLV